MLPPAAAPCATCPYRRDVPSGVWARDEYEKLPPYDGETFEQPASAFLCHKQDGRLCAGWCHVHDMAESFGLRLAVASGALAPEHVDAVFDYVSPVPMHESGAAAAAHGLAEIDAPDERAVRAIKTLERDRKVG